MTADNISVVVGRNGAEVRGCQRMKTQTTHTYSCGPYPTPPGSPGEEVKVKIVVLKDADGPENVTATTTLVATRVLVPTTTTIRGCVHDVRHDPDLVDSDDRRARGGLPGGVPAGPGAAVAEAAGEAASTGTTYTLSGLKRSTVGYYRVAALRSGTPASFSVVVRVLEEPETEEIPEEVGYLVTKRAGSDIGAEAGLEPGLHAGQPGCHRGPGGLGSQRRPVRAVSNRARATSYEVQYVENNGEYGEYGYPLRREGEDWVTVTVRNWANGLDWQNWLGAIEEIEFEERTENRRTCRRW